MANPPAKGRAADPAQAFDDLRAEVSVLRKDFEKFQDFLEDNPPADYSPDLGLIAKELAAVSGRLDALKKHPAIAMTPEQHGQAMARAGAELMRDAAEKLEQATRDLTRERHVLGGLIGEARTHDEQNTWLAWAAGGAFVLALLLLPLCIRMLPSGAKSLVTAHLFMDATRLQAGQVLIQEGDPKTWKFLLTSWNLGAANREQISACMAAAVKSGHDQACTIIVPVNLSQ